MVQEYTSAKTSLHQIAGVYKKYQAKIGFPKGSLILDYGGGAYDDAMEYMEKRGSTVLVYDPYNRAPVHNSTVMAYVKTNRPDFIICANVLNVIKGGYMEKAVREISTIATRRTTCLFTVYEGDKSGRGKRTGADQWQRNQRTDTYIPTISKYFKHVDKMYGIIIATL